MNDSFLKQYFRVLDAAAAGFCTIIEKNIITGWMIFIMSKLHFFRHTEKNNKIFLIADCCSFGCCE